MGEETEKNEIGAYGGEERPIEGFW